MTIVWAVFYRERAAFFSEIHPCEICSRLNHQLKTGDSAAAVLADVYQKTCTNLGEADDLRALLRHYRGTMKLLVYGKKIREWKYPWKVSLLVYIDKKQSWSRPRMSPVTTANPQAAVFWNQKQSHRSLPCRPSSQTYVAAVAPRKAVSVGVMKAIVGFASVWTWKSVESFNVYIYANTAEYMIYHHDECYVSSIWSAPSHV